MWTMCQFCQSRTYFIVVPHRSNRGRYTWRHDRVLEQVAVAVDSRIRVVNKMVPVRGVQTINFVKPGSKPLQVARQQSGILRRSSDWKKVVDLHGRSRFPTHICDSNLRPDIVIWSNCLKHVILIELTVPWETRIQESHERKMLKYSDLVDQCIDNGFVDSCLRNLVSRFCCLPI